MAFGVRLLRVYEPVGCLRLITQPAPRIVHRGGLLEQVGHPSRCRSGPAGARLFATVVEVVERHELSGDPVMIGRQTSTEDGEMGIAVAEL